MPPLIGTRPSPVYFNELMLFLDSHIKHCDNKSVIYLEAGHFNVGIGADDFAFNTLKDAVKLGNQLIKKYQKKIRLVYGILIDDLGMACSEGSCSLSTDLSPQENKGTATLPSELEAFFESNPLIKRDRLMVFSERTSKNRAIDNIKKRIKQGANGLVVTDVGEVTEFKVMVSNATPFLLAKAKGNIFTAKCPAIMSQHYSDVIGKLKQRFHETNEFIIIDWSEMSDRIKVLQGVTALPLMQNNNCVNALMINVFFGDDEGILTDVKYSQCRDII